MDALYLKSGIHAITPAISVGGSFEVRTNATQQVSAVGRSAAAKSTGALPQVQKAAAPPSRFFSFRHPLKSLWGGGSANSRMYKGIAVDDAVLVENGSSRGDVQGGENVNRSPEGQNDNWVLKILQVRSLWGDDAKRGVEEAEEKEEDVVNGQTNSVHGDEDSDENNDNDEDDCDACRIDDDDDDEEKRVEFDKDSFSRLLKRVSLAEAKLYAQMSYLGSLAYSIPNIKVRFHVLFLYIITVLYLFGASHRLECLIGNYT